MSKDKLTMKQERFCKEYHRNGGIGGPAARATGTPTGSADQVAAKWLRMVKVQREIARLRSSAEISEDKLWKKAIERVQGAIEKGSHYEALTAVDKLAKILGKYAPEQQIITMRSQAMDEIIPYVISTAREVFGDEGADKLTAALQRKQIGDGR